jgi:phosphomannomutase
MSTSPLATPSPLPTKSNRPIYRFGTSGYRSASEEGFNPAVVAQITHAIADTLIAQMHQSGVALPVMLGGDTREKTAMALPVIAQVLLARGLDVLEAEGVIATPVLAFAAAYPAHCVPDVPHVAGAILLTASHNPWVYGGYNFLTPDGAVAPTSLTQHFEQYQANPSLVVLDRAKLGLPAAASHRQFNAYTAFKTHLTQTLGLDSNRIAASGLQVGYDPLYAAGGSVFPKLLQESGIAAHVLHQGPTRPADHTDMPEPSAEHLGELSAWVKQTAATHPLVVGLSNDGDADRFGILDEAGQYIHPNTVLSLVLYHLVTHRKQTGWVVRSQATSHCLDAVAAQHGQPVCQTPVGYKYIAETFLEKPVLLGGESSGGLSIGGHVPEKDGLLANLLICDLIAIEQKPLSALIAQVEASVPNAYRFREFTIHTDQKAAILGAFTRWQTHGGELMPGVNVDVEATTQSAQALKDHYGTADGIKLYLTGPVSGWMLVRASGTEPLVRLYFEAIAPTAAQAETARETWHQWALALLAQHGVDPQAIELKA